VFGLSFPFHRNFDEVNLRFMFDASRVGKLAGASSLSRRSCSVGFAALARNVYGERYVSLPMRHRIEAHAELVFRWSMDGGHARAGIGSALRQMGTLRSPPKAREEQFITEHYWGYAAQSGGGCLEYRVTHPSWRVWNSRDAKLEGDLREIYGHELAEALELPPTSAFLAEGSDVAVHRGRKL